MYGFLHCSTSNPCGNANGEEGNSYISKGVVARLLRSMMDLFDVTSPFPVWKTRGLVAFCHKLLTFMPCAAKASVEPMALPAPKSLINSTSARSELPAIMGATDAGMHECLAGASKTALKPSIAVVA